MRCGSEARDGAFHGTRLGNFSGKRARMLWRRSMRSISRSCRAIVEGLRARTGSKLDVDDIVAFNAFEELPDYYVPC